MGWDGVGWDAGFQDGKGNHSPVQRGMGWDASTHGCPAGKGCSMGPGAPRGAWGTRAGQGHCRDWGGTRGTQGCSDGTQGPGAGQSRDFGCREALCPRSPVSWAGVSPLKWGGGRRNQQFPFSGQLLHPPGSSRNAARRPPLAPGTTPGSDTHPGGPTGGPRARLGSPPPPKSQ